LKTLAGKQQFAKATAKALQLKVGPTVTLANNAPHALPVEFGHKTKIGPLRQKLGRALRQCRP
jgi:hypothetical protein